AGMSGRAGIDRRSGSRNVKPRTFDYVIVGAGSAGCTLANRLTEDSDVSVLVLEAGGWDRDMWSTCRWAGGSFCSSAATTGCTRASRWRASPDDASNARAGRWLAAHRRSMRWPMFAATAPIT